MQSNCCLTNPATNTQQLTRVVRWRWAQCALAILSLGALGACGGGGGGASTTPVNADSAATGPGVLSVSPLATSTLVYATPIGKMAPSQHVLPTDHVYLYFVDPWSNNVQAADCSKRPVFAAGAGTVSFLQQKVAGGESKIMVQMTKTFQYYYDHVVTLPGIQVGSKVGAGEQIATTNGFCPSMDLGVYDLDVSPPGFVNPSRYGDLGAHPVSPYKYFTAALRSLYEARVRVDGGLVPNNKDGRVDYGIRGRLSGDWFHASLANAASSVTSGPQGWDKTISFANDWYVGAPRISIGGTIATAGLLSTTTPTPQPGDTVQTPPDFGSISTTSGIVAYQGFPVLGQIGEGWLLVQMIADDRIRVEYFTGATRKPSAFTAAAQEYVR